MRQVHIFLRKQRKIGNNSIERMFKSMDNYFEDDNCKVILKTCPVESNGFFKRVYLIFWAFCNQGDVNHVTGDINFISTFLNKSKTITTILDNYTFLKLKGFKKFLFKLFWITIPLLKSKKIHFISSKIKQETENIITDKIIDSVVIPCCVPNNLKRRIKKKFEKKILFIGSTENKNLICLLQAVKDLKVKIIIVGKINQYHKDFLLKYNIIFENYVGISDEHLNKIYAKSDILVFPSFYEGFGMPIIEANYVGIPVITSNLSPMKEISKNSSLLFDPYKPNDLKNKLILLIKNSELRNKLIINGFMNANKYQSYNIAKQFMKLYKQLIK